MRLDLKSYSHDGVPVPWITARANYGNAKKSIMLMLEGSCFPEGRMGRFVDGFFVGSDGRIWDAEKGPLERLLLIDRHITVEKNEAPLSLIFDSVYLEFVMEVLADCPGLALSISQEVQASLDLIRKVGDSEPSLGLLQNVELLPYQKEALSWMRMRSASSLPWGILCLDPGLGKTVVSLAFLADLYNRKPYAQSVVVCPASTLSHWASHFERLLPSLTVRMVSGPQQSRVRAIEAGDFDVALTSTGCARRDSASWSKVHLGCMVFDEATSAKGRSTRTCAAIRRFNADCKWALTGTPVINSPSSDLFGITSSLGNAYLGTVRDFNKRFSRPIERGDSTSLEALKLLMDPVIFRRLKQDVIDLPAKMESEVMVDLCPAQMNMYRLEEDRVRERLRSMTDAEFNDRKERVKLFGAISRLRQLCVVGRDEQGNETPSAKLDVTADIVCGFVGAGHKKVVVFTLFVEGVVDRLQRDLGNRDVGSLWLTGVTPVSERQAVIDRFVDDDGISVLIISSAAGMGVDLQIADRMVIVSPHFHAIAALQAQDRLHRIGQTKPIEVVHLIASGTIEEQMVGLSERKWEFAEKVVRLPDRALHSLSKDELLLLLGGARDGLENRNG